MIRIYNIHNSVHLLLSFELVISKFGLWISINRIMDIYKWAELLIWHSIVYCPVICILKSQSRPARNCLVYTRICVRYDMLIKSVWRWYLCNNSIFLNYRTISRPCMLMDDCSKYFYYTSRRYVDVILILMRRHASTPIKLHFHVAPTPIWHFFHVVCRLGPFSHWHTHGRTQFDKDTS